MNKLEKLQNLMKLLQQDTITPKEVEMFLTLVLTTIKDAKSSFENLSKEDRSHMKQVLDYIEKEHSNLIKKVESKSAKAEKLFEAKLKEVEDYLKEVKSIELKDGIDGKDGERGSDGIDGKDGKDGSPDTGKDIVFKINELPENDEFKIDASHIKNLPESKGGRLGSTARNLWQLQDVNKDVLNATNQQVLTYNSTLKQWEAGSGTGLIEWGEITGTITDQTDLTTYIADQIATVDTLNEISILSNTTAKSLYQMTSGANVEFQAPSGNGLLYLEPDSEAIVFGGDETSYTGERFNFTAPSGFGKYFIRLEQNVSAEHTGLLWDNLADSNQAYLYQSGRYILLDEDRSDNKFSFSLRYGQLGIGVADPQASVDVNLISGLTTAFQANSDDGLQAFQIKLSDIESRDWDINLGNHGGRMYVADSHYGMILDSSNNFGFGTHTDVLQSKVDIKSSGQQLGLINDSTNAITTFETKSDGRLFILPDASAIIVSDGSLSTPSISFISDQDTGFLYSSSGAWSWSGNGTSRFTFSTTGIASTGSGFALARNHAEVLPTYAMAGDTDTGMGTSAANTLAWSTGGTYRMNLSSTGLAIGQGSTAASARLHLISTTEQARIGYDASNYFSTTVASTGQTTFVITGSAPYFRYNGGGSSLPTIDGETITTFTRTTGAGSNAQISIVSGTTGNAVLRFGDTSSEGVGQIRYNNSTDGFEFYTGGSVRAYINSTGIGYGVTPSAGLHVLKTTEQYRQGYDAGNYMSITTGSTGSTTFALTGTTPTFTFSQKIINSAPQNLKGYTVAGLPAGVIGDTAYITDGTVVPAKGVAPVGGGTAAGVVFYDGAAWVGI